MDMLAEVEPEFEAQVKIMWSLNSSCCGDGDHNDDITGNADANATEEGKDDAM
jgi:hypothetical protein